MQPFSSIGKARLAIYSVLLLCNLIVFAVSWHVNSFHGFFYVADQAPFVLSIFTGLIVGAVVFLDIYSRDSKLSRPVPELAWLSALSLVWLCFNSFSTSRWRFIQASDCASLPSSTNFVSAAGWCKSVQALRTFVWIEWILLICALFFVARFVASGGRNSSLARRPGMPFAATFVSKPMDAFQSSRAGRHTSSFMGGLTGAESRPAESDYYFGGFDNKAQPQQHPYAREQQQQQPQQYPQQQYPKQQYATEQQPQQEAEPSPFGAYGRQQQPQAPQQYGGYDQQQQPQQPYAGYNDLQRQPQQPYGGGYGGQQQYAAQDQYQQQQPQQHFGGGMGYAQ